MDVREEPPLTITPCPSLRNFFSENNPKYCDPGNPLVLRETDPNHLKGRSLAHFRFSPQLSSSLGQWDALLQAGSHRP